MFCVLQAAVLLENIATLVGETHTAVQNPSANMNKFCDEQEAAQDEARALKIRKRGALLS